MDRKAEWIILVSLVLCKSLLIQCATTDRSFASGERAILPPEDDAPSTAAANATLTAKGGLGKVGEDVGGFIRVFVRAIEWIFKGLWVLLVGAVTCVKIVWRHLMTAGVFIFHSNHKSLVVIYRLLHGS